MLPESTPDSTQTQNENGQSSGIVPAAGGQPLEDDPAVMRKRIKDLEKENASLRSSKDKGISNLQNQINELAPLKKLAEYLQATPEQTQKALKDMVLDEMVEKRFAPQQTVERQVTDTNPPKTASSENLGSLVSELGLDMSDPAVAIAMQSDKPAVAIAKLAIAKSSPTDSANAPMKGGVIPKEQPKTQEQLLESYTKEMNAARGNKSLLRSIKEKYRALDLNVDQVAFH